jgi:hypothetical protein
MLSGAEDMTDVSRPLEMAELAWNPWRNQYGGMNAAAALQPRALQFEHARWEGCWRRPSRIGRC